MIKSNIYTKEVIHFIGIGGIGMSGIAELMLNLGYKIQGSDLSINNNIKRLQKRNIKIYLFKTPITIQNLWFLCSKKLY